jgi:hypothetical protein
MSDTNTLDATEAVAEAERFLHVQYILSRRSAPPPVMEQRTSIDGLIVIAAWVLIAWLSIGGK